jgi:hypothetical protein
MDPRSRASLIKRYQAIAGIDGVVPTSWEQIQSVGMRMQIESADPELAAVLKGEMDGELELQVLSGKWAEQYGGQSLEQQQAQQRQEYLAQAEQRMADELQALQEQQRARQMNAGVEAARQASVELANAALKAQARASGALRF